MFKLRKTHRKCQTGHHKCTKFSKETVTNSSAFQMRLLHGSPQGMIAHLVIQPLLWNILLTNIQNQGCVKI